MARPNNITLCSFCGKSPAEVAKLIAGPGVYICDNCINLCKSVLDKELLISEPQCSYCGKSVNSSKKYALTIDVCICGECLALSKAVLDRAFAEARKIGRSIAPSQLEESLHGAPQ